MQDEKQFISKDNQLTIPSPDDTVLKLKLGRPFSELHSTVHNPQGIHSSAVELVSYDPCSLWLQQTYWRFTAICHWFPLTIKCKYQLSNTVYQDDFIQLIVLKLLCQSPPGADDNYLRHTALSALTNLCLCQMLSTLLITICHTTEMSLYWYTPVSVTFS